MSRQVILFGAGHDGKEAAEFFSRERIKCFVDNNKEIIGSALYEKEVISPDKLKEISIGCDVIICISKSRWAMYSVACQLRKLGIEDFSIWSDIKKNYINEEEYLERDRDKFPCEQESVSEIYKRQLDYMVRHTGMNRAFYYRDLLDEFRLKTPASEILPATNSVRKTQEWIAVTMKELLNRFEKDLGVKATLHAGTLLGAVRHKGFIPWDDDVDVSVLQGEYLKILKYCEEADDFDIYERKCFDWRESAYKGKTEYKYSTKRFIAVTGYGWTAIFINIGADYINSNIRVFDIIPLQFYADEMTDEKYEQEYYRWLNSRLKDMNGTDTAYFEELRKNPLYKEGNKRIGVSLQERSYTGCWAYTFQGRDMVSQTIWEVEDYLPYSEIEFEGEKYYAPRNVSGWLEKQYGKHYMDLPPRVGVYVHDKERLFYDIY